MIHWREYGVQAGVLQGPVGDTWRIKYVITDGGAHGQSFTFSVKAVPIYDERARAALA